VCSQLCVLVSDAVMAAKLLRPRDAPIPTAASSSSSVPGGAASAHQQQQTKYSVAMHGLIPGPPASSSLSADIDINSEASTLDNLLSILSALVPSATRCNDDYAQTAVLERQALYAAAASVSASSNITDRVLQQRQSRLLSSVSGAGQLPIRSFTSYERVYVQQQSASTGSDSGGRVELRACRSVIPGAFCSNWQLISYGRSLPAARHETLVRPVRLLPLQPSAATSASQPQQTSAAAAAADALTVFLDVLGFKFEYEMLKGQLVAGAAAAAALSDAVSHSRCCFSAAVCLPPAVVMPPCSTLWRERTARSSLS
jgi:hypothetical protein